MQSIPQRQPGDKWNFRIEALPIVAFGLRCDVRGCRVAPQFAVSYDEIGAFTREHRRVQRPMCITHTARFARRHKLPFPL